VTWARWAGSSDVLPEGVRVQVLAVDPDCPDMRGAAWVKWIPAGSEFPRYRSCDLTDLEPVDA
jgi:hypothetical protein